jgi:protein AroM
MNRVPKLGLVTTGQGPRNEYVAYHRNLLEHLGVRAEISIRNALDGLSREEIRAIEVGLGKRCIGCHVHQPGATGDRMGPSGWTEVRVNPQALTVRFQKCIDSLDAEGVDATILCCAEEYPLDAFHAKRPLVLPWLVMTDWVRTSTMYLPEPRIGILIHDQEHVEEDIATWQSQSWMKRLKISFEMIKGRLDQALGRLRAEKVDMVIYWGYGWGIAPSDPADTIERVEEATGAPFITPQSITTLFVRHLLRPAINDRYFAGGNPVNPPGQPPQV